MSEWSLYPVDVDAFDLDVKDATCQVDWFVVAARSKDGALQISRSLVDARSAQGYVNRRVSERSHRFDGHYARIDETSGSWQIPDSIAAKFSADWPGEVPATVLRQITKPIAETADGRGIYRTQSRPRIKLRAHLSDEEAWPTKFPYGQAFLWAFFITIAVRGADRTLLGDLTSTEAKRIGLALLLSWLLVGYLARTSRSRWPFWRVMLAVAAVYFICAIVLQSVGAFS